MRMRISKIHLAVFVGVLLKSVSVLSPACSEKSTTTCPLEATDRALTNTLKIQQVTVAEIH